MERSGEIENVVLRLYDALAAKDLDAFGARFSDGTLAIGTDPTEWWTDNRELQEVLRRQSEEVGGFQFTPGDMQAWAEGTVGWVADRPMLEVAGGSLPLRMTAVLHLERGDWRIVQWHLSSGVSNQDVLGLELTTSVEVVAEQAVVDRPDLREASSPEGTVTILFTDIEDSTVLTEPLGDLHWMKLLGEHNRLIQDEVDAAGGFVVKSQGDGFMLAFASARRALHCAAGIQRAMRGLHADDGAPVRVRIGAHTGEVVKDADDFYGKSVVLASRIAARALGEQVLVSSLVRELTQSSGEFVFGDPVEVQLKGLSGTHRVHEFMWS